MQQSKIIPRIFEDRESVETERLFVHFDGGGENSHTSYWILPIVQGGLFCENARIKRQEIYSECSGLKGVCREILEGV
jgi:hypothetical protein